MWISAAKGVVSGLRERRSRREGIRVFFYHGLVERRVDQVLDRNFRLISDFRAELRLLRKFGILSLAELADELARPRQRLKTATVLTFDDGYANSLIAGDILDSARVPWSIFVATGAIGSNATTWPDELSLLILHGQANQVEVPDRTWPLKSPAERELAFRGILVPLKGATAQARREIMTLVREQFPSGETQRLLEAFPSLRMLSWTDLQQLRTGGAEICSHGVHHEIHHQNQPVEIRKEELRASRAEIEKRLGHPCSFFAFPNGDYNSSSPAEVSEAGFKLAFTTQPETIRLGANPFLLPRFDPNNHVSLEDFTRNFFWKAAE